MLVEKDVYNRLLNSQLTSRNAKTTGKLSNQLCRKRKTLKNAEAL